MNYELVKDTLKACRNPVRIKRKSVTVLDVWRDFLSKIRYKNIYPCLNITSKINVHRRADVVLAVQCCIGSTFEVSIQTVDSTKKTAPNKIGRDELDLLPLGLVKVAT